MEALRRKLRGEGAIVAGVLSGTSADGIDVAITRMRCAPGATLALLPPELHAFETVAFGDELGERVRDVLDGEPLGLRESAILARDLGRAFGRAARAAAGRAGVELDLVGSHGQTVWHHDGTEPSGPASLQLGDGDFVAEEAGCAVVSDFRQRDLAAGGEGAPISALADDLIFAAVPRPCAILNLGGMGNLTILGKDGETAGFDTGPANSLLDGLARRLFREPYDRDGRRALAGRADERFVASLLEHPFFTRRPPKSTGRDTFGERWVGEVETRGRAQARENLMAGATEFVAATVALALERFVAAPPARLIVCGGGARNPAVLAALVRRCACAIVTGDEIGLDPKAREALVFAVLAARCVLGVPSTHAGATGAKAGRVLGKISPAAAV